MKRGFARHGAVALSCWVALLITSSCNDHDRYRCGINVGENVALCDGGNEVCVCGRERCATYDKDCPSLYRYVFRDADDRAKKPCVDSGDVLPEKIRIADPTHPENSLCPEVSARPQFAQVCGDFDPVTHVIRSCTSSTEQCVCSSSGGICATPLDPSDAGCASGFAANGRCLPLTADDFVQKIPVGMLCPSSVAPTPCGTVDATGRLQQCLTGLACACIDGEGACARRVEKSVCASGLLHEKDGYRQCAPVGASVVEHGLCAGQPQPAPVTCGVPSADGRLGNCQGDETCVCSYAGDVVSAACARPRDVKPSANPGTSCASYELVHNGECFDLDLSPATVALPATTYRCPAAPPEERECGVDVATDCQGLTAARCFCSRAGSHCVVEEPGCASSLAFAGSRRCLSVSDRGGVVASGACASDGGAGGEGGGTGGASGEAGAGGQGGAL